MLVSCTSGVVAAGGASASVSISLPAMTVNCIVGSAIAGGIPAQVSLGFSVAAAYGMATAGGANAGVLNGANILAQPGTGTASGYPAQIISTASSLTVGVLLGTATASGSSATVTWAQAVPWPRPDQVLAGVRYGPTGVEYTGTATFGAGTYPTVDQIVEAIWNSNLALTLPRFIANN